MLKLALNGGAPCAKNLRIPKWPVWDEEDKKSICNSIDSGKWCRGYSGSKVEHFEQAFAKYHQAKYAVATANGTVSLQLALRAGGIIAGDEVIVPAITFIASAGAITEIGAIPIFVDSDPETLSVSPKAVESAITPRTRAIIAVHYGGYPIDFDAIIPIAKKHNLLLIEDAAHAHGSEWRGRRVGALGDFGSFSFQESKSLTAGEGGIVLTDNEELADKARLVHNIGRVLGKAEYQHFLLASNYRMPEFQGALLSSQMKRLPEQVEHKHKNGEFLAEELTKIGGVKPLKRDHRITKRGYYFFVIKYDESQFAGIPKNKFIEALKAEGVPCYSGYAMPLYKQIAFKKESVRQVLSEKLGSIPEYEKLYLPVAENFCAKEQITILHSVLLTDRPGIQMIIDSIVKIKENIDELR